MHNQKEQFKKLWLKNKVNLVNHVKPELVVQFGSSITNKNSCEDIDLIIISKQFKRMNELEIRTSIEQFFPNIKLDIWAFFDMTYVKQNPLLVNIINKSEVLYKYD